MELEKSISKPTESAERNDPVFIRNLRARLDDKNSDHYDGPDHLFFGHETSDQRLETYFLQTLASIVAKPILFFLRR